MPKVPENPLPGLPRQPQIGAVDFTGVFKATKENIEIAKRQRAVEIRRTQNLQLSELDTKLSRAFTKKVLEGRSHREKNAFGITDSLLSEFSDETANIGSSITSPEVRAAYEQLVVKYQLELSKDLQAHELGEREKYKTTSHRAQMAEHVMARETKGVSENGVVDEAFLQNSMATSKKVIEEFGDDMGKGQKWTKREVALMKSDAHTSVISKLNSMRRGIEAENYFKKYSKEIVRNRDSLMAQIAAATDEQKAQETVEKAIQSGDLGMADKDTVDALDQYNQWRAIAEDFIRREYKGRMRTIAMSYLDDEAKRRLDTVKNGMRSERIKLARRIDEETDTPVREILKDADQWWVGQEWFDKLKHRRTQSTKHDYIREQELWKLFMEDKEKLAAMEVDDFDKEYLHYFSQQFKRQARKLYEAAKDAVEKEKAGDGSTSDDYESLYSWKTESNLLLRASGIFFDPSSKENKGLPLEERMFYASRHIWVAKIIDQRLNAAKEDRKKQRAADASIEKWSDSDRSRIAREVLESAILIDPKPFYAPGSHAGSGRVIDLPPREVLLKEFTEKNFRVELEELKRVPPWMRTQAFKGIANIDRKNKRMQIPTQEDLKEAVRAMWVGKRDMEAYRKVMARVRTYKWQPMANEEEGGK